MRIKRIRLKKFKRFDDLTIDLGEHPRKLVALVGPNGCGKSSVFDAFEDVLHQHLGSNHGRPADSYYSKAWYDAAAPVQQYDRHDAVQVMADGGALGPTSFYVRSPYRYTAGLKVEAIRAKGDIATDNERPGATFRLDQRLQSNYERMLGRLLAAFWEEGTTGAAVTRALVDRINERLGRVLEIRIADLGNVSEGKGQLYFEKGTSKNFPFENLSSGEKEVVDLLIDLVVKTPVFANAVFAIDEPELHLNTAIQRRLIKELADLVPDTAQLWVATHSIGFLRALQQELADQSQILDFSERDYFTGAQTMAPIATTRANWKRIFATALEDLTGLVAPQQIVYCEGNEIPDANGAEQGLDAYVYNRVFEQEYPDVLFISSGGGGAQVKNSGLALRVLSKAFDGVTLRLLKDRDERTQEERAAFMDASPNNRMLERREIENYLFDFEILHACAQHNGCDLTMDDYAAIVADVAMADLKPLGQQLKTSRRFSWDCLRVQGPPGTACGARDWRLRRTKGLDISSLTRPATL